MIDGQGVGGAGDAHARAEVLVAVVVAVDVALGGDLVADDDVDAGLSTEPPEGQGASVFLREVETKAAVLVLGDGGGADVDAELAEDDRGGVAVVEQYGGSFFLVEWAFDDGLCSEEAQLGAGLPVFFVAVAQAQVKDGRGGVAELGGKGRGEEVGVRKGLVVDDGDGAAAGSRHTEVVRVGQVHAFHPPQDAGGAVAADHDVVAGVIGALDAGEVAGHPRGVAPGAGIPVGLLHGKGAGRDGGHFIEHLALLGGGDFGRLHGDHALGHLHLEDGGASRIDHDAIQGAHGVAHEAHPQLVTAHGHVKGKAAVHVGGGGGGIGGHQLHRGARQGIARFGVQNGTGDAPLGRLGPCGKRRESGKGHQTGHDERGGQWART